MQINLPEQGVQLHCSKPQIYQHPNQFVHKQGRGNQTRMTLHPPPPPHHETPPPKKKKKKQKQKQKQKMGCSLKEKKSENRHSTKIAAVAADNLRVE
jgi:prophage tail gpP-like protein